MEYRYGRGEVLISSNVFTARKTRLTGEAKKSAFRMAVFERTLLVIVMGLFLTFLIHPDLSLLDSPTALIFIIYLVLLTSFNWSAVLGWNQRKDGMMTYELTEEDVVIRFRKKIIGKLPYSTIRTVKELDDPSKLEGMKAPLYGRKYWVVKEVGPTWSKRINSLVVYTTSIDEGVLIERKFDTVLISPEKPEAFIDALAARKKGKTA
ncbi:hypothetical protein CR205_15410 [Alteribacter lacisalsi]|uniref:Bacterial Pleckstrin homology domain-containing protein n=1 Tax=Alteribacter lacisalsi TaxID=2045244 RepID=A0A2W0H3L3_9BACI|nr:PH domain-containing protein [Alteribacter lacisalsi]PYZ95777.1 hypothetical protein CR205_15410 [Alteribacter lacisalsi]